MKLFFILFLALPASVLARIGDTEADLIQRYGEPVFQVEAIDGFTDVKGRTFVMVQRQLGKVRVAANE